jgi:hypothetical protein
MKKFGDVLRVLSSVLLGVLMRDFDDLRGSLVALFSKEPTHFLESEVALLTSIVLVVSFVRNIHGSALYDALLEEKEVALTYEGYTIGRVITFLMGLAGMFLGPFLVGHHVARHSGGISEQGLGFILFLPFLVYAIWDFLVWFSDDSTASGKYRHIREIANNWVVVDSIALIMALVFGVATLFLRARKIDMNTELTAATYIVVAAWIIVGDYILNSSFYFAPAVKKRPERDAKTVVAEG